MRSAGMFLALLATGVLMVLVYIWSGESIVVLIMSIISLFAVLFILQWKPWSVDGHPTRPESMAGSPPVDPGQTAVTAPVWRSRWDVTWDGRGVSAVAVGDPAPQMWVWSQIDDVDYDWCPAITEDDEAEERFAVRLDFPDHRNPEEPVSAWLMLGPEQDPETITTAIRLSWRNSKITRSRLYDLTPEERTWQLAGYFGQSEIQMVEPVESPELLYREIRQALLASGGLCRIAAEADYDAVLDGFDLLLAANDQEPLTRAEADELVEVDEPKRLPELYWTLDWVAEQRGFRIAFIDQGDDDYLIGLVPTTSADDLDGQTVGSGSTRVVLDLPR